MEHPKIIIIGAGAAGIAAASRLISSNITNFVILEAADRIGGRIFTSQLDEAVVELGAQWVHGRVNNVVHSLGTSAGLITDNSYDLYKSRTILSDGSFFDDNLELELLSLCKEVMKDEETLCIFEGSLGDYINQTLCKKLEQDKIDIDENTLKIYLNWFQRFQNSIDGSDSWYHTSARGTLEYHECEGYSLTRWKDGGYANIFDILMGKWKKAINEKIIFNKEVQRISWDQSPVEVLCTGGQSFTADHVLVTVPLGVLKEKVSTLFKPPLPEKKCLAVEGLGFGTVNKIFLKFPYRWWPEDCTGFKLMWKEQDSTSNMKDCNNWASDVFGFYSVDCQPSVMCGWLVGQPAREMELCSDAQVMNTCHQLLLKFLGNHYNIPAPEEVRRSKWFSNPYTRGVYSFRSVTSDEFGISAADLAAPLLHPCGHPVVLFGGEATHDHFYSTVHGAIESGWREADRLLTFLCSESNTGQENGESTESCSVVIVGAGMAGLGAAKTLLDAGVDDFLILEGQEQAGGRVRSVPLDNTGQLFVELGAQWVHGEFNPVYKLAAEQQLLSSVLSDEGQGIYLKPNGEEIPLATVQEVACVVGGILEDCCQFVNESDFPESFGDFLTSQFTQYLDSCNDPPCIRKDKMDLFDWHVRFLVIDNSCNQLKTLSAKAWGLYQYTGGTDYNNFLHGYSSLIQSLTKDLPLGSLKTCKGVTTIVRNEHKAQAQVFCEDGSLYLADHVIVTSSLGYLKMHHRNMFRPPLPPDTVKAIENMGFDTINKLFLVYDLPWWSNEMKGIQLIWDTSQSKDSDNESWLRHVSGFDMLENLKGVLLGWVGGEGAVTMEMLSDDEIVHDCTRVLRRFLKKHIPSPVKIFRSSWHSNRFVRGGYSHTTSHCDKENCGPETLAQPIFMATPDNSEKKQPMILLAGEAVHKSYFSTTHGAYLSGAGQAQVIIDYRKANDCDPSS